MITYQSHVHPFSETFKLVEIDEPTIKRIDEFVHTLIEAKKKESHHRYDNRSHYKRYYTGTLGEVALEKYLGVSGIVDWTVGDSKKYHQADLKRLGINAGIKSVEYGLFPIIFKKSYASEIMMIRWKEKYVYICGLATRDVLDTYQSDELIKDPRLRRRNTKTAFYGFEHLKQFETLEQLKQLATSLALHK